MTLLHGLRRFEQLQSVNSTVLGQSLGAQREAFVRNGYVSSIGYVSSTNIEHQDDMPMRVDVEVHEDAGVYTYASPISHDRRLTRPIAEVTRYRFNANTILSELSDLLGVDGLNQTRRRMLLEDHLWYLGDIVKDDQSLSVPIMFARRLTHVPEGQLQAALLSPLVATPGVMLVWQASNVVTSAHRLVTLSELLHVADGMVEIDLVLLQQHILSLHPPKSMTVNEDFFDKEAGTLTLVHMAEAEHFSGVQLRIIEAMWRENPNKTIPWAAVKLKANSGSKSFDDAFKGRDWQQWIEQVKHGQYRLRRATTSQSNKAD
ncbi:MAG: hypothetical protein M1579_02090 [Gammaproteobacteria bacterium]|nr:hypothetical protein [Gammaproteobacteria bacterium]